MLFVEQLNQWPNNIGFLFLKDRIVIREKFLPFNFIAIVKQGTVVKKLRYISFHLFEVDFSLDG